MKKFLMATSAAAALGLTAGVASAATYNVTDSISLTPTELNGDLGVAAFDTNLGTLNSVSWTVYAYVESTIELSNSADSTENGSAETQVEFTLTNINTGWSLDFQDGLAVNNTLVFTIDASTGAISLDADELDSFEVDGEETWTGGTGPFETLAPWLAGGIVGFDFVTDTGVFIGGGGGNFAGSQDTDALITLSVTYDYTPSTVPVPAALPLMGAGLAALGFVARRRKA